MNRKWKVIIAVTTSFYATNYGMNFELYNASNEDIAIEIPGIQAQLPSDVKPDSFEQLKVQFGKKREEYTIDLNIFTKLRGAYQKKFYNILFEQPYLFLQFNQDGSLSFQKGSITKGGLQIPNEQEGLIRGGR